MKPCCGRHQSLCLLVKNFLLIITNKGFIFKRNWTTDVHTHQTQAANTVKAQLTKTFRSHCWMSAVTFWCWSPIPIMRLGIFAGMIDFNQSLGSFLLRNNNIFTCGDLEILRKWTKSICCLHQRSTFTSDSLNLSWGTVRGDFEKEWQHLNFQPRKYWFFCNKAKIFLFGICCVLKFSWMFSGRKFSVALCHKLSRMIGSTGRYFILQRISLWSEFCVLNCESELFRKTLRKQWLHLENMIASSVLIFILFEAIFIFVFVCSWWKRWKDLRTSWIPLRE